MRSTPCVLLLIGEQLIEADEDVIQGVGGADGSGESSSWVPGRERVLRNPRAFRRMVSGGRRSAFRFLPKALCPCVRPLRCLYFRG